MCSSDLFPSHDTRKLNSSLDKIEEEKVGFKVNINKDGIRSFFCFKENAEEDEEEDDEDDASEEDDKE